MGDVGEVDKVGRDRIDMDILAIICPEWGRRREWKGPYFAKATQGRGAVRDGGRDEETYSKLP